MLKIRSMRFLCVLLVFAFPHFLMASGSSSEEETEESSLKAFDEETLQAAVEQISGGRASSPKSKKMTEKKKIKKVANYGSVKDKLIGSISKNVHKIVKGTVEKPNKVLQAAFTKLHQKSKIKYQRSLSNIGQDESSEELIESTFSDIWLSAMNSIHQEEIVIESDPQDDDLNDLVAFSDDEEEDDVPVKKTVRFDTTPLNILLRSKASELAQKAQTLIENGASKNLNGAFSASSKMQNQKEHPFLIIMKEVSKKLRSSVFNVFLDETVKYSYQKEEDQDDRTRSVFESLKENDDFILKTLRQDGDDKTYRLFLSYMEKHGHFVGKPFFDKMSVVKDLIYVQDLEDNLREMSEIRRKATSLNKKGEEKDNIEALFSSRSVAARMSSHPEAQFNKPFQEKLSDDFNKTFDRYARTIDANRSDSQLHGREFKAFALRWAELANFRNILALHLNKYALSAASEAHKANTIKLIRYAKIYNGVDVKSEDELIFKELHVLGGLDIIFGHTNKMKWTPVMQSVFQKDYQDLKYLVDQLEGRFDITQVDAMKNGPFHLAFPLPGNHLKPNSSAESDSQVDLVGPEAVEEGSQERTLETLRALVTASSVPDKLKVIALKQKASSQYTPVSLAAATGYVECYQYLKDFLIAQRNWNEDEHAYLGYHLEEVIVTGLERLKASTEKHSELTPEEVTYFSTEISSREKALKRKAKNSIRILYHNGNEDAEAIYAEIEKPFMEIFEGIKGGSSSRIKKSPYPVALEAAIEAMKKPGTKIEKTRIERRAETVALKKKKKKKFKIKNIFKKKEKAVLASAEDSVDLGEPLYRNKEVDSPLKWMNNSTSNVKASYLAPIVERATSLFLQYHPSSEAMAFKPVYKALTGSDVPNFFAGAFNQTVEDVMKEVIIETLKKADKFRADEVEIEEVENDFDQAAEESDSSYEDESDSDESDDEFVDDFED